MWPGYEANPNLDTRRLHANPDLPSLPPCATETNSSQISAIASYNQLSARQNPEWKAWVQVYIETDSAIP